MTTLDQVPRSDDPIHLLLVADSKVGKSTYVAQAAIDGFHILYSDSDNGVSALRYLIEDVEKKPEALKRVHYFPTKKPVAFNKGLLRSTTAKPFRWIKRLDSEWGPLAVGVNPDDEVWEFDITKLPRSWIYSIDSWTSCAADALGIGRPDQAATLLDGTDQSIYGEANSNLIYIANMIQKLPCHVITQAHAGKYELYDKPLNVKMGEMTQRQMLLREIIDVPVSSSRPHGKEMCSRWNHIGWLYVNNLGETEIDFTRRNNRIGGGPPNCIKKVKDLPFSKLVKVPPAESGEGFFTVTTHGALAAKKPTGLSTGLLNKASG